MCQPFVDIQCLLRQEQGLFFSKRSHQPHFVEAAYFLEQRQNKGDHIIRGIVPIVPGGPEELFKIYSVSGHNSMVRLFLAAYRTGTLFGVTQVGLKKHRF